MIIQRGSVNGLMIADISIAADAPWNDSFFYMSGTRPLPADYASVALIIRPSFDYVTPIRTLSSIGGTPEIFIDNADEAAFSIRVAQSVVTTFPRLPDGKLAQYAQMLIFRYSDNDHDNFEGWRGSLIVNPGLIT